MANRQGAKPFLLVVAVGGNRCAKLVNDNTIVLFIKIMGIIIFNYRVFNNKSLINDDITQHTICNMKPEFV